MSNFNIEPVDSTKAVKNSRNNSMKKFRKRSVDLSQGKGILIYSPFQDTCFPLNCIRIIRERGSIHLLTVMFSYYRGNEY
jgi:hypothetical protein